MAKRFWCLLTLCLASPLSAAEGMWTFNRFPSEQLQRKFGFKPTQAWLDHVRLASVRFNSGGSGAFVSRAGLVITNHHVGADCINKMGKRDRDLIGEGFFAATAAEELKCPDLELNVLVTITDVTADIKAVRTPAMMDAEVNRAQKAKMTELEKSCADRTGHRCDVITLYQGGKFDLYEYQKFTDVRLVFAPEFQIAFFGGDPDNFVFPRYDLDVAFFRVYVDDKQYAPPAYLKWSAAGAKAGELVFTSGNPGNTERLDTVSQLEFLRDVAYPFQLKNLERVRDVLREYAGADAESARQAQTPIYAVENWLKAIGGYYAGLQDPKLLDKKRHQESTLRLYARTSKRPEYEAIWQEIENAERQYATFYQRYALVEGGKTLTQYNVFNSRLFGIARTLLRIASEKKKPSAERLREYRDSNLASTELELFSDAPIYPALEAALLRSALEQLRERLGADDPLVVAVLRDRDPAVRAKELAGSDLRDVSVRHALYASSGKLDASKDPMLQLARAVDSEARKLRAKYEDDVESVVRKNLDNLAALEFEHEGDTRYPDATFTPRLSFGKVAGYTNDSGAVPAFTNFAGLYAKSAREKNEPPWNVPPRWTAARAKLKLTTPFDFVSSNDIIGGNSGSPVINRAGELVGLVFDMNLEALANNFLYRGTNDRCISVDARAIIAALDNVYGASALSRELLGVRAGGKPRARKK